MPAVTFVSTAHAVVTVNKQPVFGDVDERMFLTHQAVRLKTTPLTQAIIPVMYAGNVKYYEDATSLPIIYDCNPMPAARTSSPPTACAAGPSTP